jgi:hypothetical protein
LGPNAESAKVEFEDLHCIRGDEPLDEWRCQHGRTFVWPYGGVHQPQGLRGGTTPPLTLSTFAIPLPHETPRRRSVPPEPGVYSPTCPRKRAARKRAHPTRRAYIASATQSITYVSHSYICAPPSRMKNNVSWPCLKNPVGRAVFGVRVENVLSWVSMSSAVGCRAVGVMMVVARWVRGICRERRHPLP